MTTKLYIVLGVALVALIVLLILYFRKKKKEKAAAAMAGQEAEAPGGGEIAVLKVLHRPSLVPAAPSHEQRQTSRLTPLE